VTIDGANKMVRPPVVASHSAISSCVLRSTMSLNGPNMAPAKGAITTSTSACAARSTLTPERTPPSTYKVPLMRCGANKPGTADDAATI